MQYRRVSYAINQASKIVAPALGGTLLLILAPQSVFLINAAISVLAAGLLLGLPHIDRAEKKATQHGSMVSEIRAGLDAVRNSVPLRSALLVMAAGYFAMFFYDTFIAPLTKALGFDETTLGLALSAVGAGGVAGSAWLAMKSEMRRPFIWVAVGSFISGIAVAILGMTEMLDKPMVWALFIGLFAVIGFSSALAVVPVRTIIQRETPPDKIARVTALSEAANTAALLAAPFAGSALASVSSIGAAFVAGGLTLVLIAIVAMFLHHRSAPKMN